MTGKAMTEPDHGPCTVVVSMDEKTIRIPCESLARAQAKGKMVGKLHAATATHLCFKHLVWRIEGADGLNLPTEAEEEENT